MKNNLLLICGLAATVFLNACGDDELPKAVPAFEVDVDGVPEVGIPIMFDNLSTNADSYQWNFGDGDSSTVVSPSHTYDEAGDYEVILTATTKDGQNTEISQVVSVGERVLSGYIINLFSFFNANGNTWDKPKTNESDSVSGPDVLINLVPVDPNSPGGFADGIFTDFRPEFLPFGLSVDTNQNPVVLTNEDWSMTLFDFDGDINNIMNADFVGMTGVTFNPVTLALVVKFDDGTGILSVFIDDPNNPSLLMDIDLFFEIQ
ncbi:MAG: PKD domain-containing protein [Bacteroidetes bacterium]|nr:PKD domain-containing protein [Bacteroidota bacterium]